MTIARFKHSFNKGGTTQRGILSSMLPIWGDRDGFPHKFHYGGQITFGPDKRLYVATGDKYYAQLSQTHRYNGKPSPAGCIIRINTDGSVPSDNKGNAAFNVKECWAWGVRNGWRSHWDLESGKYFLAEVGGNNWDSQEDIHLLDINSGGTNMGWPFCEGHCGGGCDCRKYDDPIYTDPHFGANKAIIGGAVNRGNRFPAELRGAYFFGDYALQELYHMELSGADGRQVKRVEQFDKKVGAVTCMEFDALGRLWVGTQDGNVLRYDYLGERNVPPQIDKAAALSVTTGTPPLAVTFDASATDVDDSGNSLTYRWHSGTGVVLPGRTASFIYTEEGSFEAYVEVTDSAGNRVYSNGIGVQVGVTPVPVILTPSANLLFDAKETITAVGSAGASSNIPCENFSWRIRFLHGNHYHPFVLSEPGCSITFTTPHDGHDFRDEVAFELQLTVRGFNGIEASTIREIKPRRVLMTLQSSPPGLPFFLDETSENAPLTIPSLVGFVHNVRVDKKVCDADTGLEYKFGGWSDTSSSKSTSRTLDTLDKDMIVTMLFTEVGTCSDQPSVIEDDVKDGGTTGKRRRRQRRRRRRRRSGKTSGK